jgi:hypothetical protein
VKNQNFGDNRDLLKFDLVSEILKSGLVDRFTYIPMLTRDVVQEKESHVCRHDAACGVSNTELVDFLDKCIVNDKRNINQLEEYWNKRGINSNVYAGDKYFTHEGRKAYFEDIRLEFLTNSLILIDPDKGLEERDNDSGNLLYSELKDVYEKMGDRSLLMFTQRFPYDLYETYLEMRVGEIKFNLPFSQPISLDDLDTIVFFLTKNRSIQDRFLDLLREYTKKYAQKTEQD